MDDSRIELREYLTEDGDNPFHKWLNSLKDRFARARIRVRLNRVRLGNFGDCKPVGKGVNELRVDYGPGYRVYYGKSEMTIVILLCGVLFWNHPWLYCSFKATGVKHFIAENGCTMSPGFLCPHQ